MEPNTGLTLADVVSKIATQAAIYSGITGPVVFGAIEALKKAGLPSRFAGLLTAPLGVLVVFLVESALNGKWTLSPIGILVGILAGLGTAGAYSAIKSTTASK